MEEWQLTSKEKSNLAKFEAFHAALLRSPPTRAAFKCQAISMEDPERFLSMSVSKQSLERVEPEVPLPACLQTLIRLQDEDGKWHVSNELVEALGGVIPDAPDGISEWRWATSLAIVCFQRFPEYYERIVSSVQRAFEYVDDEHLMKTARLALPPIELTRRLDPTAVRQRRWKDSMRQLYDTTGYVGFFDEERLASPGRPISSKSERTTVESEDDAIGQALLEQAVSKSPKRKQEISKSQQRRMVLQRTLLSEEFSCAKKARPPQYQVKDVVECNMRRESRWGDIQLSTKWFPCRISRVNPNGSYDVVFTDKRREKEFRIPHANIRHPGCPPVASNLKAVQNAIESLERSWSNPMSTKKEIKRLKKSRKRRFIRPEFDNSTTLLQVVKQQSPTRERRRQKKPLRLTAALGVTALALPEPLIPDHMVSHSRSRQRSSRSRKSRAGSALRRNGAVTAELEELLEKRAVEVVLNIAEHERLLEKVEIELHRCSEVFAQALKHGARNEAFLLPKLRLAAVRVVRSICAWRLVHVEVHHKGGRAAVLDSIRLSDWEKDKILHPPLIWHGANYLAKLATCLDFFASSSSLKQWYGLDWEFIRNPFLIPTGLDSRPATPISTTRKALVNGVEIEEEVESRVLKHDEMAKEFAEWKYRFTDGASWWPRLPALKERKKQLGGEEEEEVTLDTLNIFHVREAEKCVLEEERRIAAENARFRTMQMQIWGDYELTLPPVNQGEGEGGE